MLFYKDGKKNRYFKFSHITSCGKVDCDCDFTVEGTHELTEGYKQTVSSLENGVRIDKKGRCRSLLNRIHRDWVVDINGLPVPRMSNKVVAQIESGIGRSHNMYKIRAPFPADQAPRNELLPGMSREVCDLFIEADITYFNTLVHEGRPLMRLTRRQWSDAMSGEAPRLICPELSDGTVLREVQSLQALCLQAASPFKMLTASTNGKRHVISSVANLEDNDGEKQVKVSLSYDKPVRGMNERLKKMVHLFPQALELVTHFIGSREHFRKHTPDLDMEKIVMKMYLGSAAGKNGEGKNIKMPTSGGTREVKVTASGKKYEVIYQSVEEVAAWLNEDGRRPFATWSQAIKSENYFATASNLTEKEGKGRTFVIGGPRTLILEHILGGRRIWELGGSIGIGRSWSRGGMDAVLKLLGIFDDPFSKVINELDISKLDQSVKDVLVNLYWAFTEAYYKKDTTFEVVRKIIKYLIEEFTQRVTSMGYGIWALIIGGVPSGALHTSHMDTWILLFIFCLFLLYTIETNPSMSKELWKAIMTKLVNLILYGDDNWYVNPPSLNHLLNVYQFKAFLKSHFEMESRDERTGHSVVSIPRGGFFEVKGAVYLRHYCVRNPCLEEGQARYVPYRPLDEIAMKVAWGREPRKRDLVNILLSTLGHAYGTYGSNPYTYQWLKCVYQHAIEMMRIPETMALDMMIDRAEKDVIRKMRQLDMPMEALLTGFPTLECLAEKNRYDPEYHDLRGRLNAEDLDLWHWV